MNNPFDYTPAKACTEAYRRMVADIELLKKSSDADDINFILELEAGKMLGLLVAEDADGRERWLYAFSGQLGYGGFYRRGFVEPVFDYLQPDGYFKTHEAEISRQNIEIAAWENDQLESAEANYISAKTRLDDELVTYKEKCRVSKLQRATRRESGNVSETEMEEMIRQSQFEKAELHRLKKRHTELLKPLSDTLNAATKHLEEMKEKRRRDSEDLQQWLFTNFKLLNARGESRSLSEIFADTPMKIPPSGTGECCAPKLLQAAYLRGWRPVAIAEYWYGKPKGGEVRLPGMHYPACRGKCGPVLAWMLQGLEIHPPLDSLTGPATLPDPVVIYENQWFCVIDKPAGMLSVPGKGDVPSVQQWLEQRYGPDRQVKVAHRLDQDTSGLLIATFGSSTYKLIQKLFATRRVRKTYIAELDGDFVKQELPEQGRVELPLAPDWLDRPRQRVDRRDGKEAVTEYRLTDCKDGRSRVEFHPLTGRTHQLRVHAASPEGLGLPIVGDRLYGTRHIHDRLHLHAHRVEFTFPLDNQRYTFTSPLPF